MAMQAQSNRNCFLVERALGIHIEMNVCKCGAAVNDKMFVAIKNGTYFTKCGGATDATTSHVFSPNKFLATLANQAKPVGIVPHLARQMLQQ